MKILPFDWTTVYWLSGAPWAAIDDGSTLAHGPSALAQSFARAFHLRQPTTPGQKWRMSATVWSDPGTDGKLTPGLAWITTDLSNWPATTWGDSIAPTNGKKVTLTVDGVAPDGIGLVCPVVDAVNSSGRWYASAWAMEPAGGISGKTLAIGAAVLGAAFLLFRRRR